MSFPLTADPSGRYFINDATSTLHSISSPRDLLGLYRGIFAGPTSVAFLFLWLSKTHPDLLINSKSPAEYCTAYLSLDQDKYGPAETQRSGCSLNHEFMCYNAVMAAHYQDLNFVQAFAAAIPTLTLRPAFIEVLFGRAGLLSLIRTIKYFYPAPEVAAILDPHIDAIIEHCLAYDPWTFGIRPDFQKRFIGAAHGDIAIIVNLVRSKPSCASKVQPRLERILDLQTEEGNWPSCEEEEQSDAKDLVQWCYGAPGMIWCLAALRRYFPALQERIDAAIEKGRGVVWEKGLLTKEPCLCHGITGNAFALAEPQRSHFLYYATPEMVKVGLEDEVFERSSDDCGVWWSEAGRAWGWMMLDYEQSGRGDSLVDIGYPGATGP
ncbi:hypothetical protein DRE_02104 [Drechslerella stenobrocha 248]|uniref:Uncharacterized protein n=1 Tax=Drechslerella stenobrocha 248 TaxID=1043628 RepID=W7IGL1_9PEZI|nr:hypothetical protein DRE_02104 [Drechslerella stenobrocha 248]